MVRSDGFTDPGILKWVEIEDKVDDHHLHQDPPSLDLNTVPIFRSTLISQMGSVNGLICLHQYSPKNNTYICNSVTREIIITPDPQYHNMFFRIIACGFGVCSLTGEYKVVRTMNTRIPLNGGETKLVSEHEVYTLGTGEWRSLGQVPYGINLSYLGGAVLNDHCHWILLDEDAPEKICTFDLNKETFQLFPSPPSEAIEERDNRFESNTYFQSLAVLKGCLCKSDGDDSQFTIWVIKEYGIKKSWHKELVITEAALNYCQIWLNWYSVSLVHSLKDGTIFLLSGDMFAFYPRSDTVEEIDTCLESMHGYRPSFLRLQNFLSERVLMF